MNILSELPMINQTGLLACIEMAPVSDSVRMSSES